nr:hypothetical protein GCM10020185_05040 [Pseudomonas brassicacearum subsp. brassicacearum]
MGGSLVYDWQAGTYTITVPSGTVTIKVGGTEVVVTDSEINATAGDITLTGNVLINGPLQVTGDINGGGKKSSIPVATRRTTNTDSDIYPQPATCGLSHFWSYPNEQNANRHRAANCRRGVA